MFGRASLGSSTVLTREENRYASFTCSQVCLNKWLCVKLLTTLWFYIQVFTSVIQSLRNSSTVCQSQTACRVGLLMETLSTRWWLYLVCIGDAALLKEGIYGLTSECIYIYIYHYMRQGPRSDEPESKMPRIYYMLLILAAMLIYNHSLTHGPINHGLKIAI